MNKSSFASLSAEELMATEVAHSSPLLAPLLESETSALVYGPAGVGKSFFALGIAWAVASGGEFLGWRASRPHRVLYVGGEMGTADMQARLAAFGPPPASLQISLPDIGNRAPLDLAREVDQLDLMEGWGDPELVVLDSLSTLAGLRSPSGGRWDRMKRFLLRQRRYGRAMLVVHHANRRGLPRGSTHREDIFDLVIALRRPRDWRSSDGARFEIAFDKARHLHGDAARPMMAQLMTQDSRLHWRWTRGEPVDRAVTLLNSGASMTALTKALGVSRSAAYRLRATARRRGLLSLPRH